MGDARQGRVRRSPSAGVLQSPLCTLLDLSGRSRSGKSSRSRGRSPLSTPPQAGHPSCRSSAASSLSPSIASLPVPLHSVSLRHVGSALRSAPSFPRRRPAACNPVRVRAAPLTARRRLPGYTPAEGDRVRACVSKAAPAKGKGKAPGVGGFTVSPRAHRAPAATATRAMHQRTRAPPVTPADPAPRQVRFVTGVRHTAPATDESLLGGAVACPALARPAQPRPAGA